MNDDAGMERMGKESLELLPLLSPISVSFSSETDVANWDT